MKHYLIALITLVIFVSCKKEHNNISQETATTFTIAFGSCNNQDIENKLWTEIEKHNPQVWIWGGDIIYGDTEDMAIMEEKYRKLKRNQAYKTFSTPRTILGTWDDHDYGVNDGGLEFPKKAESQQLFLDFLDVSTESERRTREGVYHSEEFIADNKRIKIYVLDTRYFRTELTKNPDINNPDKPYRRYVPNTHDDGTILGEKQWVWLEDEISQSEADFNIFVSSIQFLSAEHGWETWGNMPNEVEKLENLLVQYNLKNAIILSGDRHISDFSSKEIKGLNYPLIDFTSSGMTHSSRNNLGEPNIYRFGNLVNQKSFGVLKFNFSDNSVLMEMYGEGNKLQQSHLQNY